MSKLVCGDIQISGGKPHVCSSQPGHKVSIHICCCGVLWPVKPRTIDTRLKAKAAEWNRDLVLAPASKTILLVDDDPNDLYMYSRALSAAGYRPITSLIGTEFLGIHHSENPALILLDYPLKRSIPFSELAKVISDIFPLSFLVIFSVLEELPDTIRELGHAIQPKGDPAQLVALVHNVLGKGRMAG